MVAVTSERFASLRAAERRVVFGKAFARIELRQVWTAATTVSAESETRTFWCVVNVNTVSGVDSMLRIRSGLRKKTSARADRRWRRITSLTSAFVLGS